MGFGEHTDHNLQEAASNDLLCGTSRYSDHKAVEPGQAHVSQARVAAKRGSIQHSANYWTVVFYYGPMQVLLISTLLQTN